MPHKRALVMVTHYTEALSVLVRAGAWEKDLHVNYLPPPLRVESRGILGRWWWARQYGWLGLPTTNGSGLKRTLDPLRG